RLQILRSFPTRRSSDLWFITMTIYAIVGLGLLIFCYTQTKERVVMDEKDTEKVKVSDLWVEFKHNGPLRVLAFFFITAFAMMARSEEHTSELQSRENLV